MVKTKLCIISKPDVDKTILKKSIISDYDDDNVCKSSRKNYPNLYDLLFRSGMMYCTDLDDIKTIDIASHFFKSTLQFESFDETMKYTNTQFSDYIISCSDVATSDVKSNDDHDKILINYNNKVSSLIGELDRIKNEITDCDILIFVANIDNALDYMDSCILNILLNLACYKGKRVLFVADGCENIRYDNETEDIVFEQKSDEINYNNWNDCIQRHIDADRNKHDIVDKGLITFFYPLSSLKSYVYGLINEKYAYNDFSKYCEIVAKYETRCFSNKLTYHMNRIVCYDNVIENYYKIMLDTGHFTIVYLLFDMIKKCYVDKNKCIDCTDLVSLQSLNLFNVDESFLKIDHVTNQIMDKLHDKTANTTEKYLFETFWESLSKSFAKLLQDVNSLDNIIVKDNLPVNIDIFENLHVQLQTNCTVIDTYLQKLQDIPLFPTQFMNNIKTSFHNKLFEIYDQFDEIFFNMPHTDPLNMIHYLCIIECIDRNKIDTYCLKFINFFVKNYQICKNLNKHDLSKKEDIDESEEIDEIEETKNIEILEYYSKNCANLLKFILHVVKNITDYNCILKPVVLLLTYYQTYIVNTLKDRSINYLLNIDKMINRYFTDDLNKNPSILDYYSNITKHNISNIINTDIDNSAEFAADVETEKQILIELSKKLII